MRFTDSEGRRVFQFRNFGNRRGALSRNNGGVNTCVGTGRLSDDSGREKVLWLLNKRVLSDFLRKEKNSALGCARSGEEQRTHQTQGFPLHPSAHTMTLMLLNQTVRRRVANQQET